MSGVEPSNLEGEASGDTAMALLIFSMFHCPSCVAAWSEATGAVAGIPVAPAEGCSG